MASVYKKVQFLPVLQYHFSITKLLIYRSKLLVLYKPIHAIGTNITSGLKIN